MLVRAAGRRQRRHSSLHLTQLADSLYLPFLCPAQLRWSDRRSQQISQTRLQSSQATFQSRPPLSKVQTQVQNACERQSRNLATVAESYQSSSLPQYPPPGIADASFQKFNPHIPTPDHDLPFIDLREASRGIDDFGRSRAGIGGSYEELVENMMTNLRVGRFDRAKRVIHRLAALEDGDSIISEIPYAHQCYLEARLEGIQDGAEGPQAVYEDMRDWFELQIVAKDVFVSARMVVVMIQAALQTLQGAKQERAIRRFYEIATAQGLEDDVINSEAYDDDELWRLAQIEPDFAAEELNLSPEAEDANNQALEAELQNEGIDAQAQAGAQTQEQATTQLPGVFSELAQIEETVQKGEGLTALKDALSQAEDVLDPFKYNSPGMPTLTPRQRQERIEVSSSEAAVLRWKKEDLNLKKLGIYSDLDPSRPLGALMWQWYAALLPALKDEIQACRKALKDSETNGKLNDERLGYAAHLESVPIQQIAATTILYIMSLVAGGKDRETEQYSSDMKLARLSAGLGKAMQEEAEMVARKKAARRAQASKRGMQKSATTSSSGSSSKKTTSTKESIPAPLELAWPISVKVKIGALLVSKVIETAKISISRLHPRTKETITQLQPAFLHKTIYERGRKTGLLSACHDLVRKMNKDPVGHLIAKRLPMVIEPEPWTGYNKGGYLYYPNPVIRFGTSDKIPRDYTRAAIQRGDLDQVFTALNALGKTSWRINQDILKVQIDAWNSGEPVANFAPKDPKKEFIEKPTDETDMIAMRKWKEMDNEQANLVSGFHSQRCFQNFQLEIARAFRHEKIYFPHNVDFRGRAYPIPPYLNHMGADNARALMKFAVGKELGVEGLRWLKIHLANVFGYDKASLKEREDFVMAHLDDIYDSANNPLDGRKWWLKSDDAWQTLAACFELKAALDSPEPTKFHATLPIHQDGTCNGLQHYAALGGDAVGARQVNLEPGDRPSDVYTAVADAVKAEVEADFNAGHPVAKILHGNITRKVVKQPVMTNVYGVTYYGARSQVKKQLEELFPHIKRTDPVDHLTLASYVAKKIFKSLGEMFRGAQAIQQWLGECADRISTCVTPEQVAELQREADNEIPFLPPKRRGADKSPIESTERLTVSKQLFRSSVIWTTPLRMPVVQPYRATKRKMVSTQLSNLALQEPSTSDPVSKRKQLQGFPPNFIHSLDATHMMLSANKCQERDITFASIHDSFWTHASDINDLSRILRDAFVEMHSEDIVGRLRHEFVARYKGAMYLAGVDLRAPVGKKLFEHQKQQRGKRSDKKVSIQPYQVTELLKETERMRLLASEDPEERAKGEAMITSGSIFAAEKDAIGALTVPAELNHSKLGEIPASDDLAAEIDLDASETLDPVLKDHDDVEVDDVDGEGNEDRDADGDDPAANEAAFLAKLKTKRAAPKKQAPIRKVYVWLPMQFPEVPEKGTFDVRRLKESTYFFH